MRLFTTCNSGNVHFPTAKQYRSYYDIKDELKCRCRVVSIDPSFWSDEEIPYKLGEPCDRCGTNYKYSKNWIMKCSECSGGE